MSTENNYEEKITVNGIDVNIVDNSELVDDDLEDVVGGLSMRDVKGALVAATMIGAGFASSALPITTTIVNAAPATQETSTPSEKMREITLSKDTKKDIDKSIKSCGGKLGNELAKMLEGKSDLDDLTNVAFTSINGIFIKNIPYAGGFLSAFLEETAGVNSKEDANKKIINKLNEISNTLNSIDANIKDTKNAVIGESIKSRISLKIDNVNAKYSNLNEYFTMNRYSKFCLMDRLAERSKEITDTPIAFTSEDIEEMSRIYKFDVNKKNYGYYNAFKEFSNTILNEGILIQNFECKDIFMLDTMVKNIKAGDNLKSIEARKEFIESLDIYYQNNYLLLKTSMEFEKEKYSNFVQALDDNGISDLLEEMQKDGSLDEYENINYKKMYKDYKSAKSNIGNIDTEIKVIDDLSKNFNEHMKEAEEKIDSELKDDLYYEYSSEGVATEKRKNSSFSNYGIFVNQILKEKVNGIDHFVEEKNVDFGEVIIDEDNGMFIPYLKNENSSKASKKKFTDTFSGKKMVYYLNNTEKYTKIEVMELTAKKHKADGKQLPLVVVKIHLANGGVESYVYSKPQKFQGIERKNVVSSFIIGYYNVDNRGNGTIKHYYNDELCEIIKLRDEYLEEYLFNPKKTDHIKNKELDNIKPSEIKKTVVNNEVYNKITK